MSKQILKSRREEDRQSYAKQKNLCVLLLRRTKKELLFDLKRKKCHGNLKFLKTVKTILSNKLVSSEKVTLLENEKIITDDKEIARALKDFFSNIVKTLTL